MFEGIVTVELIACVPVERCIRLFDALNKVIPYSRAAGFATVPAVPEVAPLGVTYTTPHSWADECETKKRANTRVV